MSLMLEKSKQNYEAFVLLKGRGYGIPSVHCAYYSCFQMLMYFFKDYFPDEFAHVEKGNGSKNRSKGLLHQDYPKEFFAYLIVAKIDKRSVLKMEGYFNNLRNLRIEADYGETVITDKKLEFVDKYMTDFRRIFKDKIG